MKTREDSLLPLLEEMEAAMSAHAPGREGAWASRMETVLGRVMEALRRHVDETDAAEGMFTRVELTRPTLARQVSTLRQEHNSLLDRAGAMRQEVKIVAQAFHPPAPALGDAGLPAPAVPLEVPAFGSIRQRMEEFVADLKHHCALEDGLVIETVTTDLGAGD